MELSDLFAEGGERRYFLLHVGQHLGVYHLTLLAPRGLFLEDIYFWWSHDAVSGRMIAGIVVSLGVAIVEVLRIVLNRSTDLYADATIRLFRSTRSALWYY